MKFVNTLKFIAACASMSAATACFSHVVLETKTAVAGTTYKAVFQVGHGCSGLPTNALSVQIPPGFQAAKPYAKAGWTISQDGNKSITWTAASRQAALPSTHFDEFILRGKLPDTAGPLWFAVLQTCDDGVTQGSNNWAQVPTTGTSTQGLKSPAALLDVILTTTLNMTAPPAAMPAEHKH